MKALTHPCRESALLTDLYQLTMLEAYLARGMTAPATFEFFVRRLPEQRGFLLAAGLEQALDFLHGLRFDAAELAFLRDRRLFSARTLAYLENFAFSGDVDAMREGSVFFANEPVLRVTAPLPEAQLVESRLINLLHFQTLVASKAARCVLAAPGRRLVDFGLRRAHGAEAAVLAARASFLAGFDGTATVLAEPLFGIPTFGTMAHAFVQAHDSEVEAFAHFAAAHRGPLVLLIDTYDTEEGARRVCALADRLREQGRHVDAVRLDSGDLARLAVRVRAILDAAGHREIGIFASNSLDEYALADLCAAGAPIDGFGIGTRLVVAADAPALDCVYKLQEYAGRPRRKRSTGKPTLPGRKQVFRERDANGRFHADVIGLESDPLPGQPLLAPVMRGGRRCCPSPPLVDVREYAAAQLARLPESLRMLTRPAAYPVRVAASLEALAREVDAVFR